MQFKLQNKFKKRISRKSIKLPTLSLHRKYYCEQVRAFSSLLTIYKCYTDLNSLFVLQVMVPLSSFCNNALICNWIVFPKIAIDVSCCCYKMFSISGPTLSKKDLRTSFIKQVTFCLLTQCCSYSLVVFSHRQQGDENDRKIGLILECSSALEFT